MKIRLVIAFVAFSLAVSFAQPIKVIADRLDFGYDFATFSEGLLKVKQNGKWGYINEDGDQVIQARFKEAGNFSEGLAPVKIGEKYGYIDQSGQLVIAARYSYAATFSEGLAQVGFMRGQNGYIDRDGRIAFTSTKTFKCIKDELSSEGLIKVEGPNKKIGFVDQRGNLIIKPQFDRAYAFIEGLAAVSVRKKVGFIDRSGRFVIQPKYDLIKRFDNGYTGVCVGQRWGIIENAAQTEIVRPRFADIQSFHNGRAAVQVSGKWGFINKYGDMVISPKFCETAPFNDNLTPVCVEGKWGYMDSNGNMAIPPQYQNPNRKANAFSNGMEIAYQGSKCGVIDQNGRFIVAPRYDCIYFSGDTPGLAITMNYRGGKKSFQLVKINR